MTTSAPTHAHPHPRSLPTAHSHEEHGHGELAEILDLDARVAGELLAEITARLRRLAQGRPRRRLLDLGSGTGTGAIALAERFGESTVLALDRSEEMLARVRERAVLRGLTSRVGTAMVDLDGATAGKGVEKGVVAAGVPARAAACLSSVVEPGSIDVAWAALMLHEIADPARFLAEVRSTLTPGGLLAVVEFAGAPRFLLGTEHEALEDRLHSAVGMATGGARFDPEWSGALAEAGFDPVEDRRFVRDGTLPDGAAATRYAALFLQRLTASAGAALSAADRSSLASLTAPGGLAALRNGASPSIRVARRVWIVRRPDRV